MAFADIEADLKIDGVEGLRRLVGEELGVSSWIEMPQGDVDTFAGVTGDRYWIHVDPERAARETPFGGSIVHGLMTLSLGPRCSYEIYEIGGFELGVNYGYGKVRFPAPAPVGARLRMRARLEAVDDVPGGIQVTVLQTFECEGAEKPVCVAEAITRLFTPPAG